MEKKDKTLAWVGLIIGLIGIFSALFGVVAFNRYVVMLIPLIPRMITVIVSYWIVAAVPILVMIFSKDKVSDLGFTKEKIGFQILIGVLLGIGMSLVLTLVPHLAGFGDYVDNDHRYKYLWQFIYEFFYCTAAVAAVEELCFRGFVFSKVKKISDKEIVAIIVSSVLFGLFHIASFNVAQLIITTLLGLFWCICRKYIKNCTTLSLIICHGIYDAMITVWIFVFIK